MKTLRPSHLSQNIRRVETMIECGKYHILEGIYPHIGLHICLLADDNIHNIKLIYRYISNNDNPMKTLFNFCRVYHGNSPDIKGNPPYSFFKTFNCRGVLSFAHINEMMLIQEQHFFEIRLYCLCKRIHPYIEAV